MAREVLFEITRIGNSAKATAFDSTSLVEATIVGPTSASDAQLKNAALRKLDYLLAKRREQSGGR